MSYFKFNNNGINEIFTGVSASHTGTTTETILGNGVQIPANRYTTGDFIMLDSLFSKTGASGTMTYKFYWVPGLTASLSGSQIQLSVRSIGTGTYTIVHSRRMYIREPSGSGSGYLLGTELLSTGTGIFTDYSVTNISNVAINWQIDGTIFSTVAHTNSLSSTTQYYIKIWEFPYPISRIAGN